MIEAVNAPKENGSKVNNCASTVAPTSRTLFVRRGKYRDQSPRNAPKEIGLESATRLALMNTGQNGADPQRKCAPAKCESNAGQNAASPTTNSTVLATTATLLTTSITP